MRCRIVARAVWIALGQKHLHVVNRISPPQVEEQVWVTNVEHIVLPVPLDYCVGLNIVDYLRSMRTCIRDTRPTRRFAYTECCDSVN